MRICKYQTNYYLLCLIQQLQEEDYNIEQLEEREKAIRQLESDIVDVNTIFKDLATMVHEQVPKF